MDPFHGSSTMDDCVQVILEGSSEDEENGMIDYFFVLYRG